MFGHRVRGPLKLLKERWLQEDPPDINLLDYISKFLNRLVASCKLARENLEVSLSEDETFIWQSRQWAFIQIWWDGVGIATDYRSPTEARYQGSYEGINKISDVHYVVNIPDSRKPTPLCHINTL